MSNAVEHARAQFATETTEHQMTVLHDDGVYRHLRFAKPGTGIWSWNLITWPGHLAVAGDVGNGWSFSREHDMFEWFGDGEINPSYWWQKMPHQLRTAGKHYSEDLLKQLAHEHIEEWSIGKKQRARAAAAFDEAWFCVPTDERAQRDLISEFIFTDKRGTQHDFGPDTVEWGAEDFDHHFLLALFAIVHGIRMYRDATAAASPSSSVHARSSLERMPFTADKGGTFVEFVQRDEEPHTLVIGGAGRGRIPAAIEHAPETQPMTGRIVTAAFEDGVDRPPFCGLEDCECPDHDVPPVPAGTYVTIRLDEDYPVRLSGVTIHTEGTSL